MDIVDSLRPRTAGVHAAEVGAPLVLDVAIGALSGSLSRIGVAPLP